MGGSSPAELVVSGQAASPRRVLLTGARVTIGRLEGSDDVALEPDPQQLVTRTGHLALERRGAEWFLVDGGSVNGTFLRRDGELLRVTGRTPLHDGDVACVLAGVTDPAAEASSSSRSMPQAPTPRRRVRRRPSRRQPASTTTRPGAGSCWCTTGHGTSSRSGRRPTGSSATWPTERGRRRRRSAPTSELMAAVWGRAAAHARGAREARWSCGASSSRSGPRTCSRTYAGWDTE